MENTIKGTLVKILDLEQGQGSKGNWQKRKIVIETPGQYPKNVCIDFWGDKCDLIDTMTIGDVLSLGINIESREYNGNYYTDVKAWKVATESKAQKADFEGTQEENDDLPF